MEHLLHLDYHCNYYSTVQYSTVPAETRLVLLSINLFQPVHPCHSVHYSTFLVIDCCFARAGSVTRLRHAKQVFNGFIAITINITVLSYLKASFDPHQVLSKRLSPRLALDLNGDLHPRFQLS